MNNTYPKISERQLLCMVITLSLLLRCVTVYALHIEPVSDYLAYDQMARNLVAGRIMADDFGNVAFFSGGYPLFFLTPIYMVFGHNLLAAQLGNALLGGLSTYFVYVLLSEAKAGRTARLLGPLLFALYVPSWIYCEYLAKENLMTPLMLGLMVGSARLHLRPTVEAGLVTGAIVAILAITGTAGMALLPIAFLALVFARESTGTKLRAGIALVLASALLLAPWQYRNAQLLGTPIITSNGGFNLYLGNNPNADGFFVSIAETPLGHQWKSLRQQGEVYASEELKKAAIHWIAEHPLRFVGLALKKAGLFWMPPIHEGKDKPSLIETVTRAIWLLQYIVLCLPAIYVLLTIARRNRVMIGIGGALILYTGIHMVFYVIFRYREPIMPLVIVFAAIGIEVFSLRFSRSFNGLPFWQTAVSRNRAERAAKG